MNKFITLINVAGKGLLAGAGATLFGLVFFSLSFSNQEPLNIGSLVAITSGLACVFMAFNFKAWQIKRK
ncbi:MAG: hypothetical protein ACSHW0_04650 [Thalassotalea sp.]